MSQKFLNLAGRRRTLLAALLITFTLLLLFGDRFSPTPATAQQGDSNPPPSHENTNCVRTSFYEECIRDGLVRLIGTTNTPVGCVDSELTVPVKVRVIKAMVRRSATYSNCPPDLWTNWIDPTYGVTWTANVGSYTTNWIGTNAVFWPTNCGGGAVIYTCRYTNPAPCSVVSETSVTNYFTVVGVDSLAPEGNPAPLNTNLPATYVYCASSNRVRVVATSCPSLAASGLPDCWSITPNHGNNKLEAYIGLTNAGRFEVVARAGTSAKTNIIIVEQATLSLTTTNIFVNSDDDNANGTNDAAEALSGSGSVVAGEDDLHKLTLTVESPVTINEQVTLSVSASPGHVRVWGSPNRGPNAPVLDNAISGSQTKTWPCHQMPTNLWVEGLSESTSMGDVIFTLQTANGCTTNTGLTVLDVQLAVDMNRDGRIDFGGSDLTSKTNRYRFWLNNNHDGFESIWNLNGYNDVQDDLIGGDDLTSTTITCTRDLEDYSRLGIRISSLIQQQLMSGDIVVKLETAGGIGIQVFPAIAGDSLTYLTDGQTATNQITPPFNTGLGRGGIIQLPSWLWANSSTRYLLFDALVSGQGEVKVSLYGNNGITRIGNSQSVFVNFKDVKKMYDTWTLSIATDTTASGSSVYTSSSPETGQYILFVHGMGMDSDSRLFFANTAYKRLWWQGYTGRFGTFNWPCEGFALYDDSEYNAWHTARALKNKLAELNSSYPDSVFMFAHSQGNVAAGEALRQGAVVNTYIACQAAVSAHAYDPTSPNWPLAPYNLGYSTPDDFAIFPPTGANYFSSLTGTASKGNYYNTNDWALAKWVLNQKTKPDTSSGYICSYGNYYISTSLLTTALTYSNNKYDIFAYCVQSHSYALGATFDVRGFTPVNITALWGNDPFGGHVFDEHCWHSGEFLFSTVEQWSWWKKLRVSFGL